MRCSPLADVPPPQLVEAEAERLPELRLGAIELRITAELFEARAAADEITGQLNALSADIRRLLPPAKREV